MLAYRVQKAQHVATCLTGEGARLYGGRWNPPGVALVYAAATPELAFLETLVHLDGMPLNRLPPYVLVTLALPDEIVEVVPLTDLPSGWDHTPFPPVVPSFLLPRLSPAYPVLAFAVPSVVLPTSPSRNILLNPSHPRMGLVMIQGVLPIRFDERLRS